MEYPIFDPENNRLFIASDLKWLTAWDPSERKLLWAFKADDVRGFRLSQDRSRVLLPTYTGKSETYKQFLGILDSQTGHAIAEIPTRGGFPVWIDPAGKELITSEPAPVRDAGNLSLVVWDVDKSTPLWKQELRAEDKTEVEQDLALLKTKPGTPDLLKIAYRRLRSCSDSTVPTK
jgi:hypothetical protein